MLRSRILALAPMSLLVVSAFAADEAITEQVLFPKKEAIVRFEDTTAITANALEILAPCLAREVKGTRLLVHTTKGWGWVERSQVVTSDEAVKYCKTLIERDHPDPYGFLVRAALHNQNEEVKEALADLNAAIKLDPKFAMAYTNRGWLHVERGELDKALADFSNAHKLSPRDPLIANNLAWFRATCPDTKYRDGKQAVTLATLACEQTNYKHEEFLDTLAASFAEAGDFKSAVKWVTKAREFDPDNEDFTEHLKLFQSGQPFRDEGK